MTSVELSNNQIATAFRILIVDDHRDFVEFLRVLLAYHDFAVCWAYNGPDCLETVRAQKVDLVILDVIMPEMDGLAVCRELKQLHPMLPVFLLTARDDVATRAAAMVLGVSEFLVKPVNIEDLLMRIRSHCHSDQWGKNLDTALAPGDQPQRPVDV